MPADSQTRAEDRQRAPAPPGAADAPAGRVPEFFIVGHHKCGTTALYEMLRSHPQIFMPAIKEPRFFAGDLLTPTRGRTVVEARSGTPLPSTLDEYLALFAPARDDQLAGEATPLYLLSSTAAGEIARVRPDARIIAILREPASYLRSLHLQLLQDRTEAVTNFRKALELEPARRSGRKIPRNCRRPQRLMYSERVQYVEQLRRYRAVFAREQVLVLIYEDFRSDNEGTVRQVLRFLGVDEDVPVQSTHANPTVLVRPQVENVLNAMSMGASPATRVAKTAVKTLTPRRLRRSAMGAIQRGTVHGEPPPPDEAFMVELRRRYRPQVQELSEYLGRDLVAQWGYDSLR